MKPILDPFPKLRHVGPVRGRRAAADHRGAAAYHCQCLAERQRQGIGRPLHRLLRPPLATGGRRHHCGAVPSAARRSVTPRQAGHTLPRRVLAQAASAPAVAGGAAGSARSEVAERARDAVHAAPHAPLQHQGMSDSGADGDEQKGQCGLATTVTETRLRAGGREGVGVQHHRAPEARAKFCLQRHVGPPKVQRLPHRAAVAAEHPPPPTLRPLLSGPPARHTLRGIPAVPLRAAAHAPHHRPGNGDLELPNVLPPSTRT